MSPTRGQKASLHAIKNLAGLAGPLKNSFLYYKPSNSICLPFFVFQKFFIGLQLVYRKRLAVFKMPKQNMRKLVEHAACAGIRADDG